MSPRSSIAMSQSAAARKIVEYACRHRLARASASNSCHFPCEPVQGYIQPRALPAMSRNESPMNVVSFGSMRSALRIACSNSPGFGFATRAARFGRVGATERLRRCARRSRRGRAHRFVNRLEIALCRRGLVPTPAWLVQIATVQPVRLRRAIAAEAARYRRPLRRSLMYAGESSLMTPSRSSNTSGMSRFVRKMRPQSCGKSQDMVKSVRCTWCGEDPLYVRYHDLEWGVPTRDRNALFELLMLEGMQAGLSWITVLRKRRHLRGAMFSFCPETVARLGPRPRAFAR